MTEKLELYKCQICNNLVQVILNGEGELVCCGQTMEKLIPHQEENNELAEKHTPIIEQEGNNKFIRLKHHPMLPEHYIQFIIAHTEDKSHSYLKYLNPNEIAEFDITNLKGNIEALEYCNIHGLWRNKNDK